MVMMVEEETFYQRFARLLDESDLSDAAAADLLGISQDIVRRLRSGKGSIKLAGGLRLALRLGVSPWYLACLPEPVTPTAASGREQTEPSTELATKADFDKLEGDVKGLGSQVKGLRTDLEEIEKTLKKLLPPVEE